MRKIGNKCPQVKRSMSKCGEVVQHSRIPGSLLLSCLSIVRPRATNLTVNNADCFGGTESLTDIPSKRWK